MRLRGAAAVGLAVLFVAACGYSDPYGTGGPVANESPAHGSPTPGVDDFHAGDGLPAITFPDGLKYVTLKAGTGPVAKVGDIVTMQYTGWLSDGTIFDSSRGAGRTAFNALLWADAASCPASQTNPPAWGCVIGGWNEGVPGMAVGGQRKLIIPSQLAYGAQGQQDQQTGAYIIPPNATLTFEIELIAVKTGPKPSPSPSPKPSPSPSPSHS